MTYAFILFFFFFQAEDGIRDYKVTGVQTCALPICTWATAWARARSQWPAARIRSPSALRNGGRSHGSETTAAGSRALGVCVSARSAAAGATVCKGEDLAPPRPAGGAAERTPVDGADRQGCPHYSHPGRHRCPA